MKKDVYAALTAAGIETDGSASDLYARDSAEARRIVWDSGFAVIPAKTVAHGPGWLFLGFAYSPFWKRAGER